MPQEKQKKEKIEYNEKEEQKKPLTSPILDTEFENRKNALIKHLASLEKIRSTGGKITEANLWHIVDLLLSVAKSHQERDDFYKNYSYWHDEIEDKFLMYSIERDISAPISTALGLLSYYLDNVQQAIIHYYWAQKAFDQGTHLEEKGGKECKSLILGGLANCYIIRWHETRAPEILDKAIIHMDKLLALDDQFALPYLYYGLLYYAQENYMLAISYFQLARARELKSHFKKIYFKDSYFTNDPQCLKMIKLNEPIHLLWICFYFEFSSLLKQKDPETSLEKFEHWFFEFDNAIVHNGNLDGLDQFFKLFPPQNEEESPYLSQLRERADSIEYWQRKTPVFSFEECTTGTKLVALGHRQSSDDFLQTGKEVQSRHDQIVAAQEETITERPPQNTLTEIRIRSRARRGAIGVGFFTEAQNIIQPISSDGRDKRVKSQQDLKTEELTPYTSPIKSQLIEIPIDVHQSVTEITSVTQGTADDDFALAQKLSLQESLDDHELALAIQQSLATQSEEDDPEILLAIQLSLEDYNSQEQECKDETKKETKKIAPSPHPKTR